jgi:hypothetical protein
VKITESATLEFQGFMCDFSFSKTETIYNLREENRQLRKAHQDIHTQLQDVKVKCDQPFGSLVFARFSL